MATTQDLSRGMFLRYNGQLCQVIDYQHTMPGKGGAFYQVKMKNAITGKSIENRFRSGETIDDVRIDQIEMQYLYKDGTNLMLMNTETYEQVAVAESMLGDQMKFIKEDLMK